MPKTYTYPPDLPDLATLRSQAARRRAALTAAGCATYTLGMRGGAQGIVCLCCGLGSSNPGDIANRYCGFCREFHGEWRER